MTHFNEDQIRDLDEFEPLRLLTRHPVSSPVAVKPQSCFSLPLDVTETRRRPGSFFQHRLYRRSMLR